MLKSNEYVTRIFFMSPGLFSLGLVGLRRASGFRLQASGFRLQASGFRLQASGFRLQYTPESQRARAPESQSPGGFVQPVILFGEAVILFGEAVILFGEAVILFGSFFNF